MQDLYGARELDFLAGGGGSSAYSVGTFAWPAAQLHLAAGADAGAEDDVYSLGALDGAMLPTADVKQPKQRLRWTAELHGRFLAAINALGGPDKATPKAILTRMHVEGLGLFHVKSHLQKYRLAIKGGDGAAAGAGGKGFAAGGREPRGRKRPAAHDAQDAAEPTSGAEESTAVGVWPGTAALQGQVQLLQSWDNNLEVTGGSKGAQQQHQQPQAQLQEGDGAALGSPESSTHWALLGCPAAVELSCKGPAACSLPGNEAGADAGICWSDDGQELVGYATYPPPLPAGLGPPPLQPQPPPPPPPPPQQQQQQQQQVPEPSLCRLTDQSLNAAGTGAEGPSVCTWAAAGSPCSAPCTSPQPTASVAGPAAAEPAPGAAAAAAAPVEVVPEAAPHAGQGEREQRMEQALAVQMELQRQLQQALEAQRELQGRLLAHGEFIQNLIRSQRRSGQPGAEAAEGPAGGSPPPCGRKPAAAAGGAKRALPPPRRMNSRGSSNSAFSQLQRNCSGVPLAAGPGTPELMLPLAEGVPGEAATCSLEAGALLPALSPTYPKLFSALTQHVVQLADPMQVQHPALGSDAQQAQQAQQALSMDPSVALARLAHGMLVHRSELEALLGPSSSLSQAQKAHVVQVVRRQQLLQGAQHAQQGSMHSVASSCQPPALPALPGAAPEHAGTGAAAEPALVQPAWGELAAQQGQHAQQANSGAAMPLAATAAGAWPTGEEGGMYSSGAASGEPGSQLGRVVGAPEHATLAGLAELLDGPGTLDDLLLEGDFL